MFLAYFQTLVDPKMGRLPNHLWRRAVELFLPAGREGNDGTLPPVKEMVWILRLSQDRLLEDLHGLAKVGVVHAAEPGKWVVANFVKRQEAHTSTARSYYYRKRKEDATNRCKLGTENATVVAADSTSTSSFSFSFSGSLEKERVKGEGEPRPPPACLRQYRRFRCTGGPGTGESASAADPSPLNSCRGQRRKSWGCGRDRSKGGGLFLLCFAIQYPSQKPCLSPLPMCFFHLPHAMGIGEGRDGISPLSKCVFFTCPMQWGLGRVGMGSLPPQMWFCIDWIDR